MLPVIAPGCVMFLGYQSVFLTAGGICDAGDAVSAPRLSVLQRLQFALAIGDAVDKLKSGQVVAPIQSG